MLPSAPDTSNTSPGQEPGETKKNVAKFFLALFVLVALMAWSVFYPYPGKPMDVGGFVLLWLREIIFLVVVVIALVLAGFVWLRRRLRRLGSGDSNAP